MCESCTGESKCTQCREPYFLLPDRSGCASEIKNCNVDTSDYQINIFENGT